jgi:hypothetical protein
MMVFSLFLPQNDALDVYTARANGTHLVQVTTALVPNESGEGRTPGLGAAPAVTLAAELDRQRDPAAGNGGVAPPRGVLPRRTDRVLVL